MKSLNSILKENIYLSFDSAMSYYGIIDQVIFNLKFASLYDSFDFEDKDLGRVVGIVMPKDLFFGYNKSRDMNIAQPEKALLDHIWYCEDTGQIFNPEDIDWDALDKNMVEVYAKAMGIDYAKYLVGYLEAGKRSEHPKESFRLSRMDSFIVR